MAAAVEQLPRHMSQARGGGACIGALGCESDLALFARRSPPSAVDALQPREHTLECGLVAVHHTAVILARRERHKVRVVPELGGDRDEVLALFEVK